MTNIYFDPLDEKCKSVVGAVRKNEKTEFAVFASGENCEILFTDDFGKDFVFYGKKAKDKFTFTVQFDESGIYFYRFILDGQSIGAGKFGFGDFTEEKFQLLVCEEYTYPLSRYGEIIYQIFPDRFAKKAGYGNDKGKRMKKWGEEPDYLPNALGRITNDDFFGGNFKGIEEKLPYLKSLGVTTIYLNPIVKANSSHRYDTGDYLSFDELLGSEEDFKDLIAAAKESGIKIIFDGVFNHVGDDSVYFNKYNNYPSVGAYNSSKSPYADWFTFQKYPNVYTSWWGIDILPTVRRGAKGFEELVSGKGGVLERYFSLGVSGVRLDVVDELSDGFIKKINDKVKSYGEENIVIGEVWEDATNKIAYGERKKYFTFGELDSVMNYPLRTAIIDYVLSGKAEIIYSLVRTQIDHYPKASLNLLMNIIGTHDTPRILTYLGKSGAIAQKREDMAFETLTKDEYALGVKRLKCAVLLEFTLYGNPSVYYGDETGMQGNKDPFNRRCFIEENADKEILSWYRVLGSMRSDLDCFKGGDVVNISFCKGVFTFARTGETSSVTVVVNCGDTSATIKTGKAEYEVTRHEILSSLKLGKYEFAIFLNKTEK